MTTIDWAVLEGSFDTALADAKVALDKRKQDYAGFERTGNVAGHEEELEDMKRARRELSHLRDVYRKAERVERAAREVVKWDWSDNDEDAVADIDTLKRTLDLAPNA